jgi:hypothetical protein
MDFVIAVEGEDRKQAMVDQKRSEEMLPDCEMGY